MIVAVSGGASGIGAAIVEELRSRRWNVIHGSRKSGLDVRNEHSIAKFMGNHVDAAIACAAISINSLFVDMRHEDINSVINTNIHGAFLFSRAAIQRNAKSILFIGSLSQLGAPSNAVYAASKAALVGLARAITDEHPSVRVNVLVPGFVVTPMSESLPKIVREHLCSSAAIKRAIDPGEVAQAAADLILMPLRGRVVRVAGGLLETPL